MGSGQNSIYTGRMRHGYGQYFMSTGLLFIAASALYRIGERPAVLGSAAMLWGWIKSASQQKPRYGDADFRRFLRRYQRRALLVCQLRSTIGWARKPAGAIHTRPSLCWNSAYSWGCEFRRKLDTDSSRSWTVIPRQAGH